MAINKKSTILDLSSWNLVKMITTWGENFHQVSWGSDENCGFFSVANYWTCPVFSSSDFKWNFQMWLFNFIIQGLEIGSDFIKHTLVWFQNVYPYFRIRIEKFTTIVANNTLDFITVRRPHQSKNKAIIDFQHAKLLWTIVKVKNWIEKSNIPHFWNSTSFN